MLKYIIMFFVLPSTMFAYSVEDVHDFTAQYGHVAIQNMMDYDIPASIILAQAFLESRHGTSQLALNYNNFFGIKSKKNWKGGSVILKSAEYKNHKRFVKKSAFRFYSTPEESWNDHSAFLANGRRYRKLFEKGLFNYKGWAYGLQRAGYATDPQYASKLIKLIERHHFYDFDKIAFRLKQHLAIQENSVHPENVFALTLIRDYFGQQEKVVVTTQSKLVFKAIQDLKNLLSDKFYIYISEKPQPIIRHLNSSSLYDVKIRKR